MSKILLLLFSALLACGQLRAQIINRCLDFDPTTPSDYVQTTSSPVTGNSNFTVEARFFCTSTGSNTRRLFAFGGGANNRFEISESGGALRFTRQVVGGSITTSNITSPNVRDDAWHHLAATRNGATVRVYLDGVQVYTTAGFAGVLNTTTFRIGASVLSVGATFHWDGRIDEVRVWDVERTAAEIEEFRLFWVPCTATGLKAYYRFDQGTEGGDNTGLTVLEDCNDQINGLVTDFALTGSNSNWVLSNDAAFTSALRCAANFTFAQQDCGVVNFTNTTVGTFSYSWAFGDGGTSTQTNPSHTYTTSGTYTVTLTITDLLGSCSAQKTVAVVVDNVPPTMSCKSKFVDFNTGQSGYTLLVSDILQSATDNCCAANLLTYSILSDSNFTCADACPPTPRTVTLMATDCNGNTGTCTAQVLTRDLTPPIAVCKNVNVGIGPSGTFTIAANAVDGGSTDNCVPLTLAVTPSTFGCPMQGCEEVHVVTLQATDCAGSTSTCTAQVTVRDVIGPVFVNCPSGGNLIVSDLPPNECAIPNFFTVPATDNCDMTLDMNFEMTGATNISGPGNGEGEPLFIGFTTISYLANDDCGNTSTCVFDVLVRDNQPPLIVCPPNMTVQGSTADGGATVNLPTAIREDNCPGVTVTSSHLSGSLFPCSEPFAPTLVFYTATDASGNTAVCSFTVTVECIANPACDCGPYTGVTFTQPGSTPQPVICGQSLFELSCTEGKTYSFAGNFSCNGTAAPCSPSSFGWTIANAAGTTVASGTLTGPAFSATFSGNTILAPGNYTLTLQGICGTNMCKCVIQLKVNECPPPGGFPGFKCGAAIFDCFSGFSATATIAYDGSLNDPVNSSTIKDDVVLAIADVRNHALAIPHTYPSKSWPDVHPLYHHPDWTSGKMGQIFGLAIDKQNNVYASTSTIHGQLPTGGLPGAGPGTIYKIDATTGTPSVWANLPNSLTNNGNIRSGLGDLTFDPDHNCLFASNFHDGMVYRLDMSGNILQKFDPPLNDPAIIGQGFYDPTSPPGFAPRGQRIWGIGYHKNTLYFGVWVEDQSNTNTTRDNEIWSVPLNSTDGSFTGVTNSNNSFYEFAQLERTTIDQSTLGLSPISDIAFSCSDDLVFATKTMRADYNTWILPTFAHYSTTWKISLSNLSGPIEQYYIGVGNGSTSPRTNGSGGLDIGYGSFDPAFTNSPSVLDDKIWVTADAMIVDNTPNRVYGLSGLPFSGNTSSDVGNTSIYIDADNNPAGWGKTFYGDIEIFKCLACPASVPPECDFISALAKPAKSFPKDCCYSIRLDNAVPNFFSSINIQMVEGATLNYPTDVTINTGWALDAFASGASVQLSHSSGFVPTGLSFPVKICFSNIDKPVQVFVVQYLDAQDLVLCSDTIKVTCDFCAAVTQDTITCLDGGLQQLTFCIEAADNLGYSIQSVVLTPPPGVTFTPKSFSIPPLAPGATHCTFTTTVNLGTSGLVGELCYTVTVHEADITKGVPPLRCCMIMPCTELPDCLCDKTLTYATFDRAVPLAEGLCCYDITLHQPIGEFVSVETEVISLGSTLSGVGSDPDWDGSFINPKDVLWTPDPSGTLPAVTTLPTLCFGGEAPQVLEITWTTADGLFCTDQLQFNCTDSDCAVFHPGSMDCVVFGGSAVTFQFEVTNLSGLTANHVALVNISPAGVITGQTVFPIPDLLDGAPTATLMTTLNNSVGTEACFQVNLYYKNPNDSLDIKDCCLTDTLCFTMPRCTMENAIQPIIIFPNPTRDAVTVYFGEGAPANGLLRVRDLAGRLLHEEALPAGANAHQTSVSAYPPGLYFIEVVEGERRIWSGKVARQGWD